MDEKKKRKIGKKARKYVVDNYSIETIGKYFENLFDSLPEVNEDLEEPKKNIDINFELIKNMPIAEDYIYNEFIK